MVIARSFAVAAAALCLLVNGQAMAFDIEAHRGGRALFPENTLPSFANALSMGVDTLELDIGITSDEAIVVSHERGLNPDLARAADGAYVAPPGIPFVQLRLEDVRKYDVGQIRPGSAYAAQFPEQRAVPGTPIPTLKEVLELVRKSGDSHVRLNIETKIDPNHPDQSPEPQHFVTLLLALLDAEKFSRPRDDSILRLADAAAGAATGSRDTDGLSDPAEGQGADGVSRQGFGVDRGFQSGRTWKLTAAHHQGGGRCDLVAIFP